MLCLVCVRVCLCKKFASQELIPIDAHAVLLSFNCKQTYLKEILKEIGTYNNKGAHKSTWELKPEYRHYQPTEEDEEM